jgi:hypothetical protein
MKYIDTIAPIPIDSIKEYFKDKNLMFLIDYENSKLENKVFLTYLSNLDIPCDVKLDSLSKEKKISLLEAYLDIKNIINVPVLNMMMAQIILKMIGTDPALLLKVLPLTNEECDAFIEKNRSSLQRWLVFLDSTMVFLIYSYKDLNEKLKVEENFPKIDDENFVGLNVINLLKIPAFLELYFAAEKPVAMFYFKQHFETYMFKGKSFFEFYNNDSNTFIPLLKKLISKELPLTPPNFEA